MRWLVSTSLRLRVPIVALAVILMVAGIRSAGAAPMDVFPEFAPPLVEIQTEAPGLSAEEVESIVTVPLEHALSGVSWLDTMRSQSVLGLSSVLLIFETGTSLTAARQLVQERLARAAAELPRVAHPPVMLAPLSLLSRVQKIGLRSDTLSPTELSVLAKWTIRPRLMAIPGVANVSIWGFRDRQLQVLVDPRRLAQNGVTLEQVVEAAGRATEVGTGGFVDTPNQRLAVDVKAATRTAEDLAGALLAHGDGAALRIGDVAEVVEGSPPPIGAAIIDGTPGLLLIVEKQPGANTLAVTRDVDAAFAALAPGLAGVAVDAKIFRPATFIESALANLRQALLIGCALVALTLFLFLLDWRTALISVLAIPTSLVAAVVVLGWRGVGIDTMVLAGLVIALGEVVDDAIIDVENIVRRLQLNRLLEAPRPALRVVLDASLEVRSAVVHGTLIVVLVAMPAFFLAGLAGALFRPLALAYVTAIVASLGVALTLTPALALLLLPRATASQAARPLRVLRAMYAKSLAPLVGRPRVALAALVLALAGGALATARLGEVFLPKFQERDFLMHWVATPGTSLEEMSRITARVSQELLAVPGVRNFGSHIGRAEVADEVVGPNFAELWISIDEDADYARTAAAIQAVVAGYPGLYRDVLTYLRERIKEVLTGTSASLVVRIFGDDLGELRATAADVKRALSGVDGVADLAVEPQVLVPQVEVELRQDAARSLGLDAAAVRAAVGTLVRGRVVGEVFDRQKVFSVMVWGTPDVRRDVAAIEDLAIDLPRGGQARLGDVARVAIAPTPNAVKRQDGSRRIDVTCNAASKDLGAVARAIEARVATLPLPRGCHAEVLGEYAAQRESRWRLLALAGVALAGIAIVLYVDFASLKTTALIATCLPFALVGGVAAVFATGGVISLGALVGFVTVLGIVARNGIMLVSHWRTLELDEGVPFGRELVVRGAVERVAPILMTALTTALALLPIIAGGNRPGHEIEHPMAVVVFGGLLTSTLATLALLPPLYLRFGAGTARRTED